MIRLYQARLLKPQQKSYLFLHVKGGFRIEYKGCFLHTFFCCSEHGSLRGRLPARYSFRLTRCTSTPLHPDILYKGLKK